MPQYLGLGKSKTVLRQLAGGAPRALPRRGHGGDNDNGNNDTTTNNIDNVNNNDNDNDDDNVWY